MTLIDRFLRYVSIDTQSDAAAEGSPSTEGQVVLLRLLADELQQMGAADVRMDEHGYVTATVPATRGCEDEPVIGFLAHVDTSPDAPGAGVKPQIIERDGDTIITSDGTTLLGADDKAGVAEIMTAVEWLLAHPETRHGRVRIAFTPDEEISRGVDRFDVEAFGADFAYTVDGGTLGELQYENFNAAGARVVIRGVSTHPGDARGKMVNALRVAGEFDSLLPVDERPETTEGYEGFFHLMRVEGSVAAAEMEYIIRDHDRVRFEWRKALLEEVAAWLNARHGAGTVTVATEDQYRNMREVLELHPEVVERARRAMRAVGVEPVVVPIRGGTDGARLSFMGLPCPNIFTGGADFHSLSESVSVGAMRKAVEVIVEIVIKSGVG
ncbi:MAG: peptidase T [Alistipes sp.]|jgi:tripeptide aminopeptidase|nr:peptidase T [Alistipes sp.]